MQNDTSWNAQLYQNKHSFVYEFGKSLIELLSPRAGENILDLGCGSGQLTAELAASGAHVIGGDNSKEMVLSAQLNFPHVHFKHMNATDFVFDEPFDAVFSNATLHWVKPPEKAVQCMYKGLKPGGRLVAEFGGAGNVSAMLVALRQALIYMRRPENAEIGVWYFPTLSEYATLLEQANFEVRFACLFDRPTELIGENGMIDWFTMFGQQFFLGMNLDEVQQTLVIAQKALKSTHFQSGKWIADYRRLRIMAVKK